jgi:hypothetical protein
MSQFEEWTTEELLESIHQSIDWIHRLSNSVRKASAVNQNARAASFRLEDYPTNSTNLLSEPHVRAIFEKKIRMISDGLHEEWVQRLVDTMVTRLRRILYRRSRQARWSFPEITLPTMGQEIPKPPPQVQFSPSRVTKIQPKASTSKAAPEHGHSRSLGPVPSRVTELSAGIWRRSHLGRSEISKATSVPLKQKDEIAIPNPPTESATSKNFTCPYCCLILDSVVARNSKAWA